MCEFPNALHESVDTIQTCLMLVVGIPDLGILHMQNNVKALESKVALIESNIRSSFTAEKCTTRAIPSD